MPGCILPLERMPLGENSASWMRKWQAYDGDACDLAGFPVILSEAGAWHGLCGRGGLSSVERPEVREPRKWETGWGWAGDRGLDVEWEKPEAAGNLWLLVRPQGIKKLRQRLFNLEKILNHGKNNRYRPGNY